MLSSKGCVKSLSPIKRRKPSSKSTSPSKDLSPTTNDTRAWIAYRKERSPILFALMILVLGMLFIAYIVSEDSKKASQIILPIQERNDLRVQIPAYSMDDTIVEVDEQDNIESIVSSSETNILHQTTEGEDDIIHQEQNLVEDVYSTVESRNNQSIDTAVSETYSFIPQDLPFPTVEERIAMGELLDERGEEEEEGSSIQPEVEVTPDNITTGRRRRRKKKEGLLEPTSMLRSGDILEEGGIIGNRCYEAQGDNCTLMAYLTLYPGGDLILWHQRGGKNGGKKQVRWRKCPKKGITMRSFMDSLFTKIKRNGSADAAAAVRDKHLTQKEDEQNRSSVALVLDSQGTLQLIESREGVLWESSKGSGSDKGEYRAFVNDQGKLVVYLHDKIHWRSG